MRRGVAYSRVSTGKQVKGHSLKAQEDQCLAWAKAHEVVICDLMREEGESGAKPLERRTQGRRLLDMVDGGQLDVVVAWSISRVARSTREALAFVDRCQRKGVKPVFVKEGIDLSDSAGRLMFTILSACAEWERDMISDRTRAGMAGARAKGRLVCGSYARYLVCSECRRRLTGFAQACGECGRGTRLDYVIDPERVEILRRIRAARHAGRSWAQVAGDLNAEGARTHLGKPWGLQSARRTYTASQKIQPVWELVTALS
jgi:DNA invertase Pin-like site-specific DNA recombinase